ncbi:sigma-54-dependent Fis family transcriptional regulator [Undibacterium jejuense]|uniref:Sigma-54-dependent Fis family transcriptional regulator n=1 Tax=Undibacterium jejuense TaxID=1344949 RepID=A0A923HIJ5_9BURK|nr:sigma-54-dependent Fis family transcriptional regulator [Undibacterium jejuense]MBC3862352.1 sigma-54-dependent Fis family transcriptional regulator [Undibacterium jejuense]
MSQPLPELISYLEELVEPHILFDNHYRIIAANAAYRRQFGHEVSVIGRTCYEVSHHFNAPCDQSGEVCPLAQAKLSGHREKVLHLHHTPKGESYVNIELTPILNKNGEQAYFVERMEELPVNRGSSSNQTIIGRSPIFLQALEMVSRVGPSRASVLLAGESGTGKELFARALHEASPRAKAPLVVVECASLTENLFESELFGHERGAFTGANVSRIGLVESASGGTLFLDELGDIPLTMQVKLLRLLESGTYRRVGSTELRSTDVRIVSATHRDLRSMVADGTFREDLYYRLSTFPIQLPALRQRVEDIPLLATALLSRVSPQRHMSISETALSYLSTYIFPGNVRELRNIMERAALLSDGTVIERVHVERSISTASKSNLPLRHFYHKTEISEISHRHGRSLQEVERDELLRQLQYHQGNRTELARKLGISERTLYRKLRSLDKVK